MGVYAITGGSGGIGLRVISQLEKQGHETINIDWKTGDIQADLSIPEGRQKVIDELHELHPEGLDGLILCAGVPGSCHDLRLILSLNFFGTISIIKGAYDLLEKKGGSCVATVSNAISQGDLRMDLADILNNNEDELRILDLVSNLDENDLLTGNRLYVASKYALARWVRRHSASYAANGVRINAVAPGNVNTSMTATMSVDEKTALNALPIPTKYGKETLMEPDEIASAINFLISKEARGVNGIIMFVDGGTDALLNSEKYIRKETFMEPVIQKYLTALETKDFEALAELFTKNGHYCDYCANGTSQHEFHLYGKEAISMFFRNKFLFCQYSILSLTILNGSQAEFIASYGGYQVMAIASLQQLTADGHIRRLTVRPK